MNYKKIITHEGIFHADEVLAIAYLRSIRIVTHETPIERRNRASITADEFTDPTILILDCGNQYDLENGNIDHHQDRALEATNLLVLNHFTEDKKLVEKLTYSLFQYVSDIDRGVKSKIGESAGFNSIISNFNGSDGGFERALGVAETILTEYIRNAAMMISSEELWKTLPRIHDGKVVVLKKGQWVLDWQRLAQEEGVVLLIAPNQQAEGSWNLITRDSDFLSLSEHSAQTFLHKAKFFAIYSSYESVIEHAFDLVRDVKEFVVGSKKPMPKA